MTRLPLARDFRAYDVVDLGSDGALLDESGPVPMEAVASRLRDVITVPVAATDIVVFAHGWQNPPGRADTAARRLFAAIWAVHQQRVEHYPRLTEFRPYCVALRWPSTSGLSAAGYRTVRDRAHTMATHGAASFVLGSLLGYLDSQRRRPVRGPDVLASAGGQYLHCVGHSFGCRLLGEAIVWAADPPAPPVLGWPWRSTHPFNVDSFLGVQMAAPQNIFDHELRHLVDSTAPITGPVVLTISRFDRALAVWHRLPEGHPGIGAVGATISGVRAPTIGLKQMDEPYALEDFARLTNVDASWRFRGHWLSPVGAHSDFWYQESVHLLLSLANLSRI